MFEKKMQVSFGLVWRAYKEWGERNEEETVGPGGGLIKLFGWPDWASACLNGREGVLNKGRMEGIQGMGHQINKGQKGFCWFYGFNRVLDLTKVIDT